MSFVVFDRLTHDLVNVVLSCVHSQLDLFLLRRGVFIDY